MKISFDTPTPPSQSGISNVEREAASSRASQTKLNKDAYTLDISGRVTDNNAYTGHGRTTEEIMSQAGQVNVKDRRNYMAVMSNSMSDEDFAKLQQEGFHPGSTDVDTTVTIVDHIKAALSKGGVSITGYTDTISEEALTEITGSKTYAMELKNQFAKRDIPLTKENVTAVMNTYDQLEEITELSDGAKKYLIDNQKELTPENLYAAQFSADSTGDYQGRGYYATGVSGYYAKKADTVTLEELKPQIQQVVEDAGYSLTEENLQMAGWLIEKGIPLTTDTYQRLQEINALELPFSFEGFADKAGIAIADGTTIPQTGLTKQKTYAEQAAELYTNTKQGIHDRLTLEETRLSMTVEANMKLLRSGFQIDTEPMEEIVKLLHEQEKQVAMELTDEEDVSEALNKLSLYDLSLTILKGIQEAPAALVSQTTTQDTLQDVYDKGEELTRSYQAAGEKYEACMTQPRADLGDSIRKAFRNVDDLLDEMKLPLTEENRRAVRILGYNKSQIDEDSVEQVKEKDALLTGVIREMKPGRVLRMIRSGVNPINMPLTDLQNYLNNQQDPSQELDSYSKFLYKLEKENEITEEERSAYIGVYRLVRQLEKEDHASVLAADEAGMELTLQNLLTAMRSRKKKDVNYTVDDSFGGLSKKNTEVESITSQIERGFKGDTTDLKAILSDTGNQEAEKEFEQALFAETRSAMKTEEAVLSQLLQYTSQVTPDNLSGMNTMMNYAGLTFQEIEELQKQKKEEPVSSQGEEITEELDDKETAQKAYISFTSKTIQFLLDNGFDPYRTSEEVHRMGELVKRTSFMEQMAAEENYEIPVDIDGTLTAVNLKILHTQDEQTKVAITFTSEAFGNTAAEFRMTEKGLSGYCTCEEANGAAYLKEQEKQFEMRLQNAGIEVQQIFFTHTENLNLKEFTGNQTKGRVSRESEQSAQLYQTAKAFIGFVREAGIQKGKEL